MTIRWLPATSPNGTVTYRVYRDDALLGTASGDSFNDTVDAASTHTWAVRAQDGLGFFGPLQTIQATLTAAPAATTATTPSTPGKAGGAAPTPRAAQALRATKTRTGILLQWRAGTGTTNVIAYRVTRNGKLYARLVAGTSLVVPRAKAKGSWTVYAVDAAGRVSGPANVVRVA